MIQENLKRLRIANKLTQQQVADHLMISNQSISKWEKGEALPSIEFLPQIAELFNCSVNAFFSDYLTFIRCRENKGVYQGVARLIRRSLKWVQFI